MLSERSWSQEDKCLYEVPERVTFLDTERMVAARAWEEGEMGRLVNSCRVSVLQVETVLEIDCTAIESYLTLLNYRLKSG